MRSLGFDSPKAHGCFFHAREADSASMHKRLWADLRCVDADLTSMRMKRALAVVWVFLIAFTLQGQEPSTFKVGAFDFQRPADWEWIPVSSPMRKAQLKVPGKDGAAAGELTFFHFGSGQGGDVQSNAQRWLGQFQSDEGASKVETKEMGGTKVTIVSTKGTFQSGMPGGAATPMKQYQLLGAILENKDGAVFAKLTGPQATVSAAEAKFLEFVGAAAASGK